MKVIGIDPGNATGLAFYQDGKLVSMTTIKPLMLFSVLSFHPDAVLIFEDSRTQSKVWTDKVYDKRTRQLRGLSVPEKMAKARSVGMVDGLCRDIEAWAKLFKITAYGISPQKKGKKLSEQEFAQAWNWPLPTTQHERDAALVAFPYRWTRIVA